MQLLEQLGKRLKMIRVAAGVKQKDLAEALAIPAPLLSMYENGTREPSIRFLDMYTRQFNMSLAQFFSFMEEPVSQGKPDFTSVMAEMKHLMFDLEKQALKAAQ
jgi:transcriptional regulator with XRE-family HTH domain